MKIKLLFFLAGTLITFQMMAQRSVPTTESFIIMGKIQSELVVTLADLDTFPILVINDQIIYNQKGEPKDTVTNMKGVLLKSVLTPIEYVYDKPKQLNEF